MPAKYPGLRALLRPCMEGVAAPFSDEGESVVYTRFYAEAPECPHRAPYRAERRTVDF